MSQDDFQTGSLEVEVRAREIHSALSNGDSMRIFGLAADGIDASTSVLKKYQFTKKRYYGRLKELVDLGLISKENGEYKHSPLGKKIFENQVKSLEQILLTKNEVSVEDMKTNDHSVSSIIMSHHAIGDIEASIGVQNLEPVKFFDNWNELSMDVAVEMETMRSEFFVATRYVDFRSADSALRAAKRGCKINILHSNRNGLSTKLQLMGNLMANPKALAVFKELTTNQNIVLRETMIPYSFLVIDAQVVGLEVVNPEDPYSFFFGLKFRNEVLASKLISHFEALSRSAEKDSIASAIESNAMSLEKQQHNSQILTT